MNYYNEFDPKAAAWLRELIREGHIAPGEVDERSISEVKATDLSGFTQCHFFAGIGGWSYALRLAGWPDDQPVWTGSCPCQPFSAAGKQMGRNDPRHLWPAFRRLINRGRPPKVFGEQVASKAGRGWLAGVLSDLEIMGYAGAAADLCSAGVGSPNIRQRLFWMAEPEGKRGEGVEPQRTEGFGERPRSGCDSPDSASSLGMAYPIGERGCSGPSGSPDAGDARQPVQSANNRERERERLTNVGWPTPSSRDWKDTPGMNTTGINPDGSTRTRLDQLPRVASLADSGVSSTSSTAPTEKRGALNPALSRWLMGYPAAWDSCGATAMQSTRSSRRSSSKPAKDSAQ